VAGGAEITDIDIFREQAGDRELRAVGFAEIEVDIFRRRLVAGRLHIEPLQRIGFFAGAGFVKIIRSVSELRSEFGDEIRGDFVAAGADGWADRGEEIGGLAAVFELHAADSFLGDAGEGAAPTGVNRGNGSFSWIDQKNRYAIGGLDGKQKAGADCGGSIAFANVGRRLGENTNYVRVDLLEWDQFEIGGPDGGLKQAAIFDDVFAGVPFHEAEVKNFFGFEPANPAEASAETVDEPGKLAKRGKFENLQSAGLAEAPGCGNARYRRRRGRGLARATTLQGSFSGSHNQTSIIATG
jgi:hypothetical protein